MNDLTLLVVTIALLVVSWNQYMAVRVASRHRRYIAHLTYRVLCLEGKPAWTPERDAEIRRHCDGVEA